PCMANLLCFARLTGPVSLVGWQALSVLLAAGHSGAAQNDEPRPAAGPWGNLAGSGFAGLGEPAFHSRNRHLLEPPGLDVRDDARFGGRVGRVLAEVEVAPTGFGHRDRVFDRRDRGDARLPDLSFLDPCFHDKNPDVLLRSADDY